jgi:hypothetical protein
MTDTRTVPTREAAAIVGVSADTMKRWRGMEPPRGPAFQKLSDVQQGRCLYAISEIRKWQADPQAYEKKRSRQHARSR